MVTPQENLTGHSPPIAFISYARQDTAYLERIQVHLKPWERDCTIDCWADTRIRTGERWREEIKHALSLAKVAVLIVSADFLASDFIYREELPPLLKAEKERGLIVIPVIAKFCGFQDHESLREFATVNSPDRPLREMKPYERDRIYTQIARDIVSALRPTEIPIIKSHESETI